MNFIIPKFESLDKNNNSICLNMIVKDEAHIIKRTLENLTSHINFVYWVICDTGSIDDTRKIITDFFKEKNIPGELHDVEWQDFGYNRTVALNKAYNKTDYLLIFDADDSINGKFILPTILTADKYNLFFGDDTHKYIRPLLINNRKKWKFICILHETLNNIDPINSEETIYGDYHITSGREGNRNKNPTKYLDDASLLEKEIALIQTSKLSDIDFIPRYTFYCAQSYNCAGIKDKAIEFYKKVLDLDTWAQEKYVAALTIGNIYKSKNNIEEALDYWYKAISYDKERSETVINIMEYFYNKGNHFAVNCLHDKIKDSKITDLSSKLFLDISRYHDIDYYNSISASNLGEWMSGYYSCKKLLLNDKHVETTLYNFKCYAYNIHLDPDNNKFLDKLLILFDKYFDSKRELIKQLWNMVAKNYKNCLSENFNDLNNKYTGLLTEKENLQKKKINKNDASKKILIYTGFNNVLWNDTYIGNNSCGGAEKAVAYLSHHFPKDYEIIISGDVADEVVGNIRYVNRSKLQALLDSVRFHTIIVSRYISFFLLFPRFFCYKLLISTHDIVLLNGYDNTNPIDIMKKYMDIIDGVICLTCLLYTSPSPRD